MDDGRTRVSVRTTERVDASKLVAAMGGGGHARRAGAITGQSVDVARAALESEAQRILSG